MKNNNHSLPGNNWLKNKKVFITGATSGIGRSLALLLAGNGSRVYGHGRSANRLQALIAEAPTVTPVSGDLETEQGRDAVAGAIKEYEPEVLVLNAGFNVRKSYVSGWRDAEIMDMLNVNLVSPIFCARNFAGLPRLAEPRRLALILSTSCHYVREKMSLYVACKTGLMGFGKTIQQEAGELGVRTVLFYPGRTDTGIRDEPAPEYMSPGSVARVIASVLCLPDDVVPYEFTFRPEVDTRV